MYYNVDIIKKAAERLKEIKSRGEMTIMDDYVYNSHYLLLIYTLHTSFDIKAELEHAEDGRITKIKLIP